MADKPPPHPWRQLDRQDAQPEASAQGARAEDRTEPVRDADQWRAHCRRATIRLPLVRRMRPGEWRVYGLAAARSADHRW
jgi:hypothetical protein